MSAFKLGSAYSRTKRLQGPAAPAVIEEEESHIDAPAPPS